MMRSPSSSGRVPGAWTRTEAGIIVPGHLLRVREAAPIEMRGMGLMPEWEILWDSPPPSLDELLAMLRANKWLEALRRVAFILTHTATDSEEKQRALLRGLYRGEAQTRMASHLRGGHNHVTVGLFPVLVAMELAASRCPALEQFKSKGVAEPEAPEKLIHLVWTLLNGSDRMKVQADPAGVAAAIVERSSLRSMTELLRAAYGVWLWEHPGVTDEDRRYREDFSKCMQRTHEMTLEEWVRGVATAEMVHSATPLEHCKDMPLLQVRNPGLTEQGRALIEVTMSRLSSTLEEFQVLCRRQEPLLEKSMLLPLKLSPAIRLDGASNAYVVLSPTHVAEAAFERPVRMLESENKMARWGEARTQFGQLVETYVHGLFGDQFGDRYFRLPPEQRRKRTDGLLQYPGGVILVECKAMRVTERHRYGARTDAEYLEEMRKRLGLGDEGAVKQIRDTAADLRAGKVRHVPVDLNVRVIGSIIVVFQDLPQTGIAESVLGEILPPTREIDGSLELQPLLMSLFEAPELSGWGHLDLLAQLVRKQQVRATAFESLRNYLLFARHRPGRHRTQDLLRDGVNELVTGSFGSSTQG